MEHPLKRMFPLLEEKNSVYTECYVFFVAML